ncbi:hypothetical protein EBR96_05960, partial [bacterium]|nr:hypothetical protein [bacterium]
MVGVNSKAAFFGAVIGLILGIVGFGALLSASTEGPPSYRKPSRTPEIRSETAWILSNIEMETVLLRLGDPENWTLEQQLKVEELRLKMVIARHV